MTAIYWEVLISSTLISSANASYRLLQMKDLRTFCLQQFFQIIFHGNAFILHFKFIAVFLFLGKSLFPNAKMHANYSRRIFCRL